MLSARVESGAKGEPIPQALRLAEARDCEYLADGQLRYHPEDSYTAEGELRVYTKPLGGDAGLRPTGIVRYAVHDVVNACLVSCMQSEGGDDNYETHVALVIRQHEDGTCDVRLADDLPTSVLRVGVQHSADTIDADTRERLREYDSDMHCAVDLYTESGAHVSRHATSVAQMNDGAAGGSARRHNDD